MDRLQELVGESGTAPWQPRDHLDLPPVGRCAVVSGLPLEAAFTGLGWFPVLDRADGRACGVRVSSRAGQERIPAIYQYHRPARVPGGACVRGVTHAWRQ